ncbi:STAS domain-containing protein [bacterium]|nr:STAS domain-containing protein [bacterium]
MKVETKAEGDTTHVIFHGNMDLGSVEEVRRELDKVGELDSERFVLDFQNVGYVDSAGLGALVVFHKTRQGKSIVLKNVNDRVRKLFQITRLDSVFKIE